MRKRLCLSLGLLASLVFNTGMSGRISRLDDSLFGILPVSAQSIPVADDAVQYSPPKVASQSKPPGQRQAQAPKGCAVKAKFDNQKHLTALIPDTRGGLTLRPRPTFWVYLPPGLGKTITFEFLLKEIYLGSDYTIHTKIKSISDTSPGFIQIPLPDNLPPLKLGRQYQWTFAATCHGLPQLLVNGLVTRQELLPEFQAKIDQATPQQQVRLFAQRGYWYEALNLLADYRLEYPEDVSVQRDWTSLLQSVQLDGLASFPMKECCFP